MQVSIEQIYSSWSFEDLKEIDNEDGAKDMWNNVLETADANRYTYCHGDVKLTKNAV